MEDRIMKKLESLDELAPPANSVTAVAITGSKNSKYVIRWALEKFVPEGQIYFKFIHVRPVLSRIPTPMGNYVAISQVRDDIAAAFRKEVEWQATEKLLPYKKMCSQRQVEVEISQIESDDIENAISREIEKNKICNLVIGTSSRGIFSRGPSLSSKISQSCPQFCNVYAVSKGKLSSVRASDSETNCSFREEISIEASCSSDSSSIRSLSSGTDWTDQGSEGSFSNFRSTSLPAQRFQALSTINENLLHKRTTSNINVTDFNGRHSQASSSRSSVSPFQNQLPNTSAENQSNINFELEKLRVELRHARGMYVMAQGDAIDASRKINELHKQRLDEEIKFDKISFKEQEAEVLARQESERYVAVKKEANFLHYCAEQETTGRKEAELIALREEKEKENLESALAGYSDHYQKFTWEEIVTATSSFSESRKIGMGTYGTVYKCSFHHTTAAVKVLHVKGTNRIKQFHQELEILSRIRHPHLLILLGACPDHASLVYEFMENGSLEDRLFRKNNTPPLLWYDRFRIAWEVASALAFLHNSKPKSIIHRDLKPGNILLDRNFVSKIGDVGLSTIVNEESRLESANSMNLVGTLCYIDPEYQRTGVISPESDVYALGIIILQLLTGKLAVALVHVVENAMESDRFVELLDTIAGEWPIEETKSLALMALKCTELRRRDRPHLSDEVLPCLEKLKDVSEKARNFAFVNLLPPPNHFLCPILKEVMNDPCVAADGYTYDRKAIEEWIQEKDTSPMTNLLLAHKFLIPNNSLLSAIMDWKSGK